MPQGMADVLGDMLTSISDLLPEPKIGTQLNFDINGVGSLAYAGGQQEYHLNRIQVY